MRRFGMVLLVVLVSLLVATPVTFAKVCHPKKPITCTATHLTEDVAAPAVAPAPVVKKSQKVDQLPLLQPKVQHAMVCGPWVKWMCSATPGLI